MRSNDDIKVVTFELSGSLSLDMERVEMDPIWDMISQRFLLEDPVQRSAALRAYIGHYLSHEHILAEMPSTNGPVEVYFVKYDPPKISREELRKQIADADLARTSQ